MTSVKVSLDIQRLAAATVQACGMCEYAKLHYVFFVLYFNARFQHENVKLFGNLLPCRAFIERSPVELSSARMFDATSLVEHMPHSVLGRLRGGFFFSQSCGSGHREEGLVRDSSCPVVSIMTCMTWPKTQGQQKHTNNAALLTDFTSCHCVCITSLCQIKLHSCHYTSNDTQVGMWVKRVKDKCICSYIQ